VESALRYEFVGDEFLRVAAKQDFRDEFSASRLNKRLDSGPSTLYLACVVGKIFFFLENAKR